MACCVRGASVRWFVTGIPRHATGDRKERTISINSPEREAEASVRRLSRLRRQPQTHHKAPEPTISVVIPTLNEAANLPHVLTRIPPSVSEVIVVDGHSIDDTVVVARSILPDARILLQSGRGKGNALACGFAAATGEIIVMLDADGSTDPAEIPDLVAPLLRGADFAKGSRFMPGGDSADITPLRKAGNRMLTMSVNLLHGTQFTDLCYGYNAFRADCLDSIRLDCQGFEVETMINVRVARAGLQMVEVPSVEAPRLYGESKLRTMSDGWRVLRTILRERVRGRRAQSDCDEWRPHYHELAAETA